MRFTFLGTSAGESYPAIFCECPNCTYARTHGGRNLRVNTGSMIDDDVLLDLNNVGYTVASRLGISLAHVKTVLATHPHGDHMTREPYEWRRGLVPEGEGLSVEEKIERGIGGPAQGKLPLMTVYGNQLVHDKLIPENPAWWDGEHNYQLRFQVIECGRWYEAENLRFFPVKAIHGPVDGFAYSYIIERDGRRLLYALDTGGYEPEWQAFIDSYRYDAVIMEGTFGLRKTDYKGHQTIYKNRAFRQHLIEKGCIGTGTPFYLTHLCPHWTPPYDIYAPMMEKEGFTVAYDGMQIEI
ncbi:MAG: hypothetical protein IJM50_01805 [Lachnospiraceae bacterium]|nr:hypothetical protein [Lachnospiraceae bacterium]